MPTIAKTLYDTDFAEWTAQTAELLRQGRFEEIYLEHVVEEIEDLGNSDFREARSQLRHELVALIAQKIQPASDEASWRGTVVNAQTTILDLIGDSPSFRRRLADVLPETYGHAVQEALFAAGLEARRNELQIPAECPLTLSQLLGDDLDSLRM